MYVNIKSLYMHMNSLSERATYRPKRFICRQSYKSVVNHIKILSPCFNFLPLNTSVTILQNVWHVIQLFKNQTLQTINIHQSSVQIMASNLD